MQETEIITFGCRLNTFESEVIRRAAATAGLSDTVIVNTCAVTAEAERQARQAIRRARRRRPEATIIVTGCAAEIAPERYAALPEVDHVLGNREKLRAESYLPVLDPPPHAREGREGAVNGFEGKSRAFLQVQQGCDHRCTFCIIPYARGPSRSVPMGLVADQASGLVAAGYREIVLTGVDLTAYGADLPGAPSLGQMIRRLLAAVPELERLRLSSLDPAEIDAELWRLLAEERRLMPHLHLSLQAGDDLILKRMKRRHSRAQAIDVARRARGLRPEVALGADLIAGFPTETEDMFRRSLDLVAECGLAFVHVFPYSERPGTPAARMPQLPGPLVKERAARLRSAGKVALAAELSARVGSETDVLIERPGRGRAEFYAAVSFSAPDSAGAVRRMRLVGSGGGSLVGVPV
ncbi:MAG TPA: tRNA (N(6)-L-threonylcarbamoyladenosine(37)-C(2))-methylthiotransferase MtaB [Stellaceae bacterium]|nr:tRNA (N(6)-L-threonylcarbamoyladenosine(37)-C(2))-methylthiotransferase MtaB [Stellaceae bacterium]HMD64714.1 tRNA (N(6)-L-threonylcarbamoyladenosine(37)-C(2))-methylthiotransferase MtaB [Stellaceae bacterium]